MADDEKKRLEEAKKAKQAEIDRKRAEVRKRMEEASKAKKAKKGFMTPERKKKLRLLLRKKAAEELKKEQERKAAERRRIIEERCGKPKNVDDANEEMLKRIIQEYHDRVYVCEGQKWDLEHEVRKRDFEIADLNSQVNDLRGKFVKPTLKKVSKYENKFAKLQKKAAEFNFRNQLKVVKKKEFTLEEEDKEKKPDWSKGKPGDQKVKEEEVEA
ncbi:troponin I isoform X10 [Colias croceus]|uniref:troponin I isoform X10 n=1 Tax=Colias crocea TaxID=72248 RepID=UPI001E280A89|nr:troponin I isoform X10 [Colias croceus]